MQLGKRFKDFRKKLNLTQAKLAEALSCKQATIADYEKGRITPSAKILNIMVENYNLNVNWLLTGEGPMFLNQEPNTNNVPAREETSKLKKLEEEIAALKKSITELEKECQELDIQNKELNNKLVHRMQELLDAKDKLLELSKA